MPKVIKGWNSWFWSGQISKFFSCLIHPHTRAVLIPVIFQNSLSSFVFPGQPDPYLLTAPQVVSGAWQWKDSPQNQYISLWLRHVCGPGDQWNGHWPIIIHDFPMGQHPYPIPAHQLSQAEQGDSWCFKPGSKLPSIQFVRGSQLRTRSPNSRQAAGNHIGQVWIFKNLRPHSLFLF